MFTHRSRLALLWSLPAMAACQTGSVPLSDEADPTIDEQSILAGLKDFRTSPAFVSVNENAYETALGTGAAINVFVSAAAHDAYSRIDADSAGSGVTVPEGTRIVREVLEDIDGKVKTLTLMVKGPPGYNPDVGDFWFGVTDPDGAVIQENGVRKAGKLQECFGCHIARAQDGYLFGVPAGNRPGVTPPEEPPVEEPPVEEPPVEEPPVEEPPVGVPTPVCGDFFCERGQENCASCDYDCGFCPDEDDDDDDEDDDDHGGGDDDDSSGD